MIRRRTPLKPGQPPRRRAWLRRKTPLKRSPVRRKAPRRRGGRNPDHLRAVGQLPCIVCEIWEATLRQAEVHHLRDGYGMGQRAPDCETIPLCRRHHRTGGHGVAYHAGAATWEARYGTERHLLALTLQRLPERLRRAVGSIAQT